MERERASIIEKAPTFGAGKSDRRMLKADGKVRSSRKICDGEGPHPPGLQSAGLYPESRRGWLLEGERE